MDQWLVDGGPIFSLCLHLDKSGSIKQSIDPTLSHDRPPFNHHKSQLRIEPEPIFWETKWKSGKFKHQRELNSALARLEMWVRFDMCVPFASDVL